MRRASGPRGTAEGAPGSSAVLSPLSPQAGSPPAVPQAITVTRPDQAHRRKRVPYHPPPPTVQRGLAGESTCSGYRRRKNQNYFPQGCELERIKPNLGTLSALSAPHDKIDFCSQHSAGGDAGSVVPATPHVPGHSLCWGRGCPAPTQLVPQRVSAHRCPPGGQVHVCISPAQSGLSTASPGRQHQSPS